MFTRGSIVLKSIYLLVFLGISSQSLSQERCATVSFNEIQESKKLGESKPRFENWLKAKKDQKLSQVRATNQTAAIVYQIPVVVHVVHNGESYGVDGNILDEQILSQITTLNQDFRRTNADQSDTPAEFLDVVADIEIEFVLAKRDPEGLPTDGIVRVQGNQEGFTIDEAEVLAANSYWPAEEYMNIWVADLKHGTGDGLLGFAKFPLSDLEGLDENSTGEEPTLNRLIDGVYMDYEYFGTGYNTDSFSKGRTMTHEVGHWLGLRHIWGDGGCSIDDFCDDTPAQSGSTSFNKTCEDLTGKDTCTEDGLDMFQNFLDYTADECMNLFTECQKLRMRTVLENSPRRKELLQSSGGMDPSSVANDLGVKSIVSPTFGNCSLVIIPEIEVRNYGTNDITAFAVDFLIDDQLIQTLSVVETLTPLQSLFIDFTSITIASEPNEVTFKVKEVNGTKDGNPDNDCKWVSTYFPQHITVPFAETFANFDNWHVENSNDQVSAWVVGIAPYLTVDNSAAVLAYNGSSDEHFGELDYLISPVFDLSELATADIRFRYAYSGIANNYSDALSVIVSTDCGATFPESNVIFRKAGNELKTTTSTNSTFVPAGPSDWVDIEEPISQFSGQEVVIAFVGSNGGGNHIYLDDIEVFSSAAYDYDLGITSLSELPVVTCRQEVSVSVMIKNYGKQVINDFMLDYAIEGHSGTVESVGNSLEPGKTIEVELEIPNVDVGDYQLLVMVNQPNGRQDEDLSNNSSVRYFDIDMNTDLIPVREKFSSTLESSDWHFVRTDSLSDWQISEFRVENRNDYALTLYGFDIKELGRENWLVSPVLDFSGTNEASMTFDVSYANRTGRNDQLKVLGSVDCGQDYPFELYSKKGGELAVTQSEESWVPDTLTDWRQEFINLDQLAGAAEVRLAFVVTNQNGNNIYLDNIEFYESGEEPLDIEQSMLSFPNPASEYIEVKFNFNIKEEILIRIVSLDGEVLIEKKYPNTLNQIYRLYDVSQVSNGLYILQVLGNNTNLSSKVLVQH